MTASEPMDLGFLSLPPLVPDQERWTCSACRDDDIDEDLPCRLVHGHYGRCRDRHGDWFDSASRVSHTCTSDDPVVAYECDACAISEDARAIRRADR